jgi:hypothetical protein
MAPAEHFALLVGLGDVVAIVGRHADDLGRRCDGAGELGLADWEGSGALGCGRDQCKETLMPLSPVRPRFADEGLVCSKMSKKEIDRDLFRFFRQRHPLLASGGCGVPMLMRT